MHRALDAAYALFVAALSIWIISLIPQAVVRESEWRQDRLCRYYAEEVNLYAHSVGEVSPCL